MRRTVPVLVATVGVLALLASFHSTPGVAGRRSQSVARSRPPAGAAPPTSGAAGAAPTTVVPPAPSPTRVIDGPVVSNFYGDVQVEIKVAGRRLVDVRAVQLPSDRIQSQEISSFAGPALEQEALQARSANIDIVSGATYTSESFAQSLQAALNRARLA